jgi:hypothetical protein
VINNAKLFEFIYESVISDGGDGDLAVVFTTQDHRVAADQFEKFLATKSGRWNRENLENGDVVFWDNQESFVFSNHDHCCDFLEVLGGKGYPEGKTPCSEKVVTP